MFEMLSPGRSLTWDLLWQSSVFLAIGLAVSLVLRGRPARSHRVLVLMMIAALCTPLLAQAIRHVGWGLLRQPDPVVSGVEPGISTGYEIAPAELVRVSQRLTGPGNTPDPLGRGRSLDAERNLQAAGVATPSLDEGRPAGAVDSGLLVMRPSWRRILLAFWVLLSGLAIVRFVASSVRGFRLVRGSVSAADPSLNLAISRALTRVGLAARPELRTSQEVRCPSVWCWGRQPLLLVPARVRDEDRGIDWVAIFCHELAHWRRLDHIASLAGELLVCVLPWNPLAWWARTRLAQLAELACDDWVLACGSEGTEYVASLLELVPRRGPALALAALSSRGGLVGRVRHILDERRSSPTVGKGWALLAFTFTLLVSSALALAQARSASSRAQNTQNAVSSPTSHQPRKEPVGMKRTVHLEVQGPEGNPVANAIVLWLGASKPALGYVALPHDDPERRGPRFKVLARAQTDEQGHRDMSAEFSPGDDSPTQFLVTAPGFGICSRMVRETLAEATVKITLAPEVLIHGRLLTPAGAPAAGVRVLLNGFQNDAKRNSEGIYTGLAQTDEELPVYWPRPRKTDSEGRFTIEGVPREAYANLSFWHPDYAVDEVTVSTVADGTISPGLKAFEIVPVQPTFTHTLEPARPVQGRITDRQTGKPIAGMLVEMTPMRSHGGMPFPGRTDADGRFRISGHQANFYITSVYPKADSGYLATSETRQGWPAGAKFLEVNFAMEKGRLIHGRVIDRDTKQPVQGATVMYQPASKNPNNKQGYDLRNTVLTAGDGTFRITGLPGDGMLVVEVPDPDALRTPISGTMYDRTAYPHGSVTVNIPTEGEPKPVEIAVRKGVTIEARVLDPGGQVVRDVVAFYPGIQACLIDVWNQGQEFPDGIVRIHGADPERTYRVCFIKPDRKLAAVAELKYDGRAAGPIEVRLQTTASVRGKVATAGGSVSQGCQVYASLLLNKDRKELSNQDLFNHDLVEFYANVLGQRNMNLLNERTGSAGEFTMGALIPGASFYVTAAEGGGRAAHAAVPDLKPGEDRDLGTLVLKERQR